MKRPQEGTAVKKSLVKRLMRGQSVAQAAVLLSLMTFLSKFTGFARDAIVAHNWGATGQTDAFLIGMMVPSVLLGIMSTGLSTLIVPWYIDHRKEDPERARELVNQVTFVWGMLFAVVSVLMLIFAPQLVRLFAPTFKGAQYDLAVKVTRLLIPMGFFNVMTGLVTGLSQAEGQFLIPLVVSLFGNLVMVACLLFFSSPLGIQSYSLGLTFNSFFSFAPVFLLLSQRYHFFQHLDLKHINWVAIGGFALLLVPLVISGGGGSLNTIVDRWFASHLTQGSVSALDYSNRLWNLPLGLVALPLVTAVFPWFSSMAVDGTPLDTYATRIKKTVALLMYITIPCIAGLVTLAEPLVRILFQRGKFDVVATRLTASCVQMYCLGLIGQALFPVFHRVFYSFKDTRTPLIVGVTMITINGVTDWLFGIAMRFGAPGIALSSTAAVTVGAIMDVLLLGRYFRGATPVGKPYPLFGEFGKTLIAVVPVVAVALVGKPWIGAGNGFLDLVLRLVVVCGGAAVSYMVMSSVLRIDGWSVMLGRIKRRLPGGSPLGSASK
ncbi:MAG: murein biosynthesis integral membrane protein MurJ [Candidatus Cryosericum sp.]